jgi:hypothetical protein
LPAHLLTPLQAEDSIGCPTEVLQLLAHACTEVLDATITSTIYSGARLTDVSALERSITQSIGSYTPAPEPAPSHKTMLTDLHRLATLLYLNRAVHHISSTSHHHRTLTRTAISLLTLMGTCHAAWPLFIIACEAADDASRLAVLAVFEQTRRAKKTTRRRTSHVRLMQQLAEAVWKQRDLDEEGTVEYLAILDAVIGGTPFVPLFA